MQFKAVCSKENQRFVLIIQADSIETAKDDLHAQGYSIMQIDPYMGDTGGDEEFFYFDAINQLGTIQMGKIQSNDIFKAYVKLVEEMNYNVKYIYPMEGVTEEEKLRITAKVKSGYDLSRKIDTDTARTLEHRRKEEEAKIKGEDLYENLSEEVKKDLARYEKIIENITVTIEKLLLEQHDIIGMERQTRLRDLVQMLNQVKSSTNISRIKTIAETALKKIGELQVEIIKKREIQDKERYLAETNKLLKDIGSKEHFEAVHKENALETLQKFTDNFFTKSEADPNEKVIDTNSFVYFKNLRELNVYKKKLLETEFQIFKNTILFRFDHVKRFILKRKLLLQNIQIIDNRITNKSISYSRISKGFRYYSELFFGFFYGFGEVALYSLLIFSFIHIFTDVLPLGYHMSGSTIQIIVFLAFFALLSRGMRDIIMFLFSWFILFFVIYFISVNF